MNIVKIPKKVVAYLLYGDSAAEAHGYIEVAREIGDEWRWGHWYTLVVKDAADNYWAVDYQVQSGDNYYNSLEEKLEYKDAVEFYRVAPETVTITEYRKVL